MEGLFLFVLTHSFRVQNITATCHGDRQLVTLHTRSGMGQMNAQLAYSFSFGPDLQPMEGCTHI